MYVVCTYVYTHMRVHIRLICVHIYTINFSAIRVFVGGDFIELDAWAVKHIELHTETLQEAFCSGRCQVSHRGPAKGRI